MQQPALCNWKNWKKAELNKNNFIRLKLHRVESIGAEKIDNLLRTSSASGGSIKYTLLLPLKELQIYRIISIFGLLSHTHRKSNLLLNKRNATSSCHDAGKGHSIYSSQTRVLRLEGLPPKSGNFFTPHPSGCYEVANQCDQIGRIFALWATF